MERDLEMYENGLTDGFTFLVYCDGEGMFVPNSWISSYPDWEEKWGKFMEGQTVCMGGIFIRDLRRFLNILEKNNE